LSAVTGKAKPTLWVRVSKYFREVRSELRKVAWPNRKELLTYTGVVVVAVIFVAIYIEVVDVIVSELLTLLGRIGR
jgi:preprotein translocase subunit SecE